MSADVPFPRCDGATVGGNPMNAKLHWYDFVSAIVLAWFIGVLVNVAFYMLNVIHYGFLGVVISALFAPAYLRLIERMR
jgi:hypothetical protein